MMSDKQTEVPIQIDQMLQGTRHYSKVKTCCPSQLNGTSVIQAQRVREALDWFPKYRGMHFVWVTKQTTAWVVFSFQGMQWPNALSEGLVCVYSVLPLGQYTLI